MALVLDHVVIHVSELEAAIADYTALGFTVQRGGSHADGATHNALVGFADGSYLELIAFLAPSPAHRWAQAAERGHEGFVDFALLPASVAATIDAARGRGLAYQGPIDGGRLRPDGQRLQWQIGTPPTADLPFLCGDVTPRALRVREGEVRVHPNGAQGVAAITVAVTDLDASLDRYRALLGPQVAPGEGAMAVPGLGLRLAALSLGPTALVLAAPGPARVLAAPGPDPDAGSALRESIARHGEGLIGIALRGPSDTRSTPASALPRRRCHGAAIEIVPG